MPDTVLSFRQEPVNVERLLDQSMHGQVVHSREIAGSQQIGVRKHRTVLFSELVHDRETVELGQHDVEKNDVVALQAKNSAAFGSW